MNVYLRIIQTTCLNNKYTKWYIDIINHAINRDCPNEYTEKHHIIPKCFSIGHERDNGNIVSLTGKEHYICHQLLVRMVSDKTLKLKLSCAALRMAFSNDVNDRYKITAAAYEMIKTQLSKNKKGTTGKKWTVEQRAKLKSRIPHNKGVPMSETAKQNLREKRKLQVVKAETRKKVSDTLRGKPWSQKRKDAQLKKLVIVIDS
jgi:hypothetical protein